jgi:hypothetical protein
VRRWLRENSQLEQPLFCAYGSPALNPVSSLGIHARSCAALALVGTAFGCSEPHLIQPASLTQELAGGTIDPDSKAVFAMSVLAPNPILCSATLVAPNLLITARHCVTKSGASDVKCGATALEDLVDPNDIVVDNVLSFLDSPSVTSHTIERIDVPSTGNDVCGYDLATLQLSTTVDTGELALRLHEATERGEPYRAVGYGTQTTSQGSRAGVRLQLAEQQVTCVSQACTEELAGTSGPVVDVAASEFVGSAGVCRGDSGGPAIDASGRVFGIASRSAEACQSPVYTSLSAFSDFLHGSLERAADAGAYEASSHDHPTQVDVGEPEPEPDIDTPKPDVVPLGEVGDACDSERPCNEPLACYYVGAVENATCVASCSNDNECSDGEHCHREFQVCEPHSTAGDQGCSISKRAPPAPSAQLLLLCLGVLLGRRGLHRACFAHGRQRARSQRSLHRWIGLAVGGCTLAGSVGGCGNDATQPAAKSGVIEPSPAGSVAGAGAGGESPIAQAGAGDGGAATDGPALQAQAIGQPCSDATDCPTPLTCLRSTVEEGAGAPPGGLCTLPCSEHDACTEYRARCIDFAGAAYCVESCEYKARTKCHSRQDFACEPTYRRVDVSCDVDSDCAQNAVCRSGTCFLVIPVCLPRCRDSGDCPDTRYCDPVSGECVSQAPIGDPVATPCAADAGTSTCRGLCLRSEGDGQARCTEFCRLGTPDACGADAACLLTLGTAGGSTPGDQGACARLCSCNSDCPSGMSCLPIAAFDSEYRGYCAVPDPETETTACSNASGGAAGTANN